MDKEDTISFIRSLLITKNGLYDYSTFLRDFQKETGYALPKFGYKTSLDFLRSLPDTVQVKSLNHEIFLAYVDNFKTSHIRSLIQKQGTVKQERFRKKNYGLDKNIFEDFNELNVPIRSKSAECCEMRLGVHNWKFNNNNNNNNNNNLGYDKKQLSSIILVPLGKCDQSEKQNHEEINIKENLFSIQKLDSLSSLIKQSVNSFNGLRENSYLHQEWKIPKLDPREYIIIGEYIEIFIPAVYNPFKFSLQLRKFKKEFIKLMEQMQSFYNKMGDNYKIGNSVLKKNDPCAVLYKSKTDQVQWHRAEIITFERNFSTVLFIDSGIVMEIENSDLRYLCRSFGALPAQALKGHLANIRPCSGKCWSKEANQRFLDLVYKKDLIAGVVDVNYEEFWVSVALSETGEEDIHINDTLVAENLAAFDLNDFDEESFLPLDVKNEHVNENSIKLEVSSYSEDNKRLLEMFQNVQRI